MAHFSYNGWEASANPADIGVDPDFRVDGIPFPGGVKAGDVSTVFAYLIHQMNTRVEALVDGWNWGYAGKMNVNDPSTISCHASGTAIDYMAPNHPNGPYRAGWNDEQVATIYAILDECGGVISWLDAYDAMHFELQATAGQVADVAHRLSAGGGAGPDNGDDDVNDADIEKIADAVMERLRTDDVVSYNKTDAGSGKETQVTDSVVGALGSAATYAGRAAYRATEADKQTE